jgi:hypothetical protein
MSDNIVPFPDINKNKSRIADDDSMVTVSDIIDFGDFTYTTDELEYTVTIDAGLPDYIFSDLMFQIDDLSELFRDIHQETLKNPEIREYVTKYLEQFLNNIKKHQKST